MKTRHVKIVSLFPLREKLIANEVLGGEIGHRKYDCPEARNFTANIICRVCGNAGHMARDCPDRQRGADWRNGPEGAANGDPTQGRIGGGEAVDREMEQFMQELGGSAPSGGPTQRIEAGPGGYGNGGQADGYGRREPDQDQKPWQRAPTGGPAPWQQRGGDDRGRDNFNQGGSSAPPWASRGGDDYGGYGRGQGQGQGQGDNYGGGGAAPWQRQDNASGGQYNGYGAYPGSYDQGGYGGQQSMGAPPGLANAAGLGAPPGLGALFQNFAGNNGAPPPPPPAGGAPPPPSSR